MDNTVTLAGNLTRDPELRFTNSGQAVAGVGIAVNRRWTNRTTGETEEQVSFFDVTAWGTLGENVAGSLGKGDRVVVTGRLQQRSYETESGDKRSVYEVIADEVAPSLRWATAKVERNAREGGGSSRPAPTPPPGETYSDEEPF